MQKIFRYHKFLETQKGFTYGIFWFFEIWTKNVIPPLSRDFRYWKL